MNRFSIISFKLNFISVCFKFFLFCSAIYVVDLDRFRRLAAGDRLRGQYQVSEQSSTDQEGDVPYTCLQLFQQRLFHKIL